jgi:ribosomal protein S18 acetylase RimI-like enzyme
VGMIEDERLASIIAELVASEAGATEMSLWTMTENAPAQAFYESHGWRPDGSEGIHPIAEARAIRMRRPLP